MAQRRGFTKVENVVFGAGLTSTELAVWIVVKSHEFGRRPFPLSYKQIADEAGTCRGTAIRTVNALITKGALIVLQDSDKSARAYRCLLPRVDRRTPPVQLPHPPPVR